MRKTPLKKIVKSKNNVDTDMNTNLTSTLFGNIIYKNIIVHGVLCNFKDFRWVYVHKDTILYVSCHHYMLVYLLIQKLVKDWAYYNSRF